LQPRVAAMSPSWHRDYDKPEMALACERDFLRCPAMADLMH
jgi:hypothetical protein